MLRDLNFAIAYLDGILIKSETRERHTEHILKVILASKWRKIRSILKKIKYLSHMIAENSRIPDPTWSSAIKEKPAPKNAATLQAFSRLAKSYNIFIKKYTLFAGAT